MRHREGTLAALMLAAGMSVSAYAQSAASDSASHALNVAHPAADLREKACILAAAQRVPTIVGTVIAGSRAQPSKSSITVELDVRAAGVEVTYGFACRIASGGAPIAVPTGLLR